MLENPNKTYVSEKDDMNDDASIGVKMHVMINSCNITVTKGHWCSITKYSTVLIIHHLNHSPLKKKKGIMYFPITGYYTETSLRWLEHYRSS
jgi:hypothetical protein